MLPIAGTHHLFLKEIPLNAEYEIHLYLTGWEEQKWIYLTIAFITRGDRSTKSNDLIHGHKGSKGIEEKAHVAKELLGGIPDGDTTSASLVIVPPVAEATNGTPGTTATDPPTTMTSSDSQRLTASASQSGNKIPSPSPSTIQPKPPAAENTTINNALKAIRIPEGSTLHAVAVSQYCYKLGRVTVPPRVALIACGFGATDNNSNNSNGETKNRNRWERLVEIRNAPDGDKTMRQILRGGWRDRQVWGDFWDFEEYEEAGRKAGDALKQLRLVMGALGGEATYN